MYLTQKRRALIACRNSRQIDGLSCEIQAADSPGLCRLIVDARSAAQEANHETTVAYLSERSPLHASRNDSGSASAATGDGRRCTTGYHLRVGWSSSRRPDSGHCAKLFCACAIRRRLRRPPCRLSDFHDDEFRFHRHRHLSGRARVLRQRGVCSICEGKEREGSRYRFFRAGIHRGFRRGRSRARTHTREGSRWFRRCFRPRKPKG